MYVSGDKGGAVVTGASALSSYSANELVAQGIIDKMIYENKTLGQAIVESLQELGPGGRASRINWMNLGDPTLKINQ